MLDEYYAFRGWDDDGVPTDETLERLELTPFCELSGRTNPPSPFRRPLIDRTVDPGFCRRSLRVDRIAPRLEIGGNELLQFDRIGRRDGI